jgi:hypothetical protein
MNGQKLESGITCIYFLQKRILTMLIIKNESGVFHTYASELLYAPSDEGQDPRPKTQDMSILFGHYGTCLILFQ